MESFYGGRRGQSFELVKTYPSVAEMVQDFSSLNCTVYYGQYVTIDSTDEDRGKIYKRTGNLNNGYYGAVQVGILPNEQGVGTSLTIKPYNNIIDGEDLELGTVTNDLVNGADQEETIKIRYKTALNPETDKDETQIGFKLPYNKIDWTIDPDKNVNQVEIIATYEKPFHQAYLLASPIVTDGDKIKQIIKVTNDNISSYTIYEYPGAQNPITVLTCPILAYQVEKETINETYTEVQSGYNIFNPKVQGLYEYINNEYTRSLSEVKVSGTTYYMHTITRGNPEYIWYKLCDFSQAEITYDEESATITITGQESQPEHIYIRQTEDFSLGQNGLITMTYLDGSVDPSYIKVTPEEGDDPSEKGWYEEVEDNIYILSTDTEVDTEKDYYEKSYKHTQIINEETPLQWITDISYDENSKSMVVTYNTGNSESFESPVNSVSEISYDQQTGKLYVTYTNPVTIDNYDLIENGVEIQDFSDIYDIASKYYQDLENRLDAHEIQTYEEYKQEIVNICNTFKLEEDLYDITEDEQKKTYSYDNEQWDKIYFNKNGTVIVPKKVNIGTIESVIGIDYTSQGLNIRYNTGREQILPLNIKGISSIAYDENHDNIIITYSDGTTDSLGLALRVTSIRFNSKNQLVFRFNDNTEIITSKSIEYPSSIQFNSETQKLEMIMNTSYEFTKKTSFEPGDNPKDMGLFEYNEQLDQYFPTEDTTVEEKDYYIRRILGPVKEISPAINYIQDVQINPETYELLILLSDSQQQGDITYNGITGWKSLGYVKDQSGIFITEVIDSSIYNRNYGTIAAAIDKLNHDYPNGRHGNPYECVAVGGENESKTVFGFDRDKNTWYLLGRFSGNCYIAAATEEQYSSAQAPNVENLPSGGMWFVIREENDDYAEYLDRYGVYWEEY